MNLTILWRYALYMDDGLCLERALLLRLANAALARHSRLCTHLRAVARAGRSETFKFLMKRATESEREVKQLLEAYQEHLRRHGCIRVFGAEVQTAGAEHNNPGEQQGDLSVRGSTERIAPPPESQMWCI